MGDFKDRENLDDTLSEDGVKKISDFDVNGHNVYGSGKHHSTLNSKRSSQMALVLRIGTGGD